MPVGRMDEPRRAARVGGPDLLLEPERRPPLGGEPRARRGQRVARGRVRRWLHAGILRVGATARAAGARGPRAWRAARAALARLVRHSPRIRTEVTCSHVWIPDACPPRRRRSAGQCGRGGQILAFCCRATTRLRHRRRSARRSRTLPRAKDLNREQLRALLALDQRSRSLRDALLVNYATRNPQARPLERRYWRAAVELSQSFAIGASTSSCGTCANEPERPRLARIRAGRGAAPVPAPAGRVPAAAVPERRADPARPGRSSTRPTSSRMPRAGRTTRSRRPATADADGMESTLREGVPPHPAARADERRAVLPVRRVLAEPLDSALGPGGVAAGGSPPAPRPDGDHFVVDLDSAEGLKRVVAAARWATRSTSIRRRCWR